MQRSGGPFASASSLPFRQRGSSTEATHGFCLVEVFGRGRRSRALVVRRRRGLHAHVALTAFVRFGGDNYHRHAPERGAVVFPESRISGGPARRVQERRQRRPPCEAERPLDRHRGHRAGGDQPPDQDARRRHQLPLLASPRHDRQRQRRVGRRTSALPGPLLRLIPLVPTRDAVRGPSGRDGSWQAWLKACHSTVRARPGSKQSCGDPGSKSPPSPATFLRS